MGPESDGQFADTLQLDPQQMEETPAPSSRSLPLPASLRARYENLYLIGEGAMGTVFRGWDPQLGRAVAIKLLKGDDPEDTRRFLQEAKAQARIQHDNVCRVYDAGMADGEPYIAMEFIDGAPLDRAKSRMSLEQKVKVVREVAAALHEAHRLGLIHRDIKPSNIMIATGEDGALKPYVVDFGLAREISSSGETTNNMIVGTPAYMSPEQAHGASGALDRRSDVYSLGATLYELVAGRTPFVGSNALSILTQVMLEEAPTLRVVLRDAPSELETIVMTCLQREPSRRYESARALGDDLQRFLDGEPIQAKRASIAYVLRAKARKNKPAVIIGGVGLCAVLVLSGMWIRTARRASEQAMLGRELGEDVKYMELFLRSAYGFPPHDIEREQRVIRERLTGIERRMAEAGRAGKGPGHYALGRGHLALHDYMEAKLQLEQALASGYAQPEVHYALGLALGALYQDALDKTRRIEDKTARDAAVQKARTTYRDPAVWHLRESGGTEVESKLYIDGLVALYENRYEDAAAQAIAAAEDSPWLYEAKKLEGDARFESGVVAGEGGHHEDARRLLSLAVQAYKAAADMATSDAAIHEALAEGWIQLLELDTREGRPYQTAFAAALAACDDAIKSNPRNSNAFSKKGRAYFRVGDVQLRAGEDPRSTLTLAIENGVAAKRLAPDNAMSDDAIGNGYTYIAKYERKMGRDPTSSLELALKSFDDATRILPTFAWAWNDAGIALKERAQREYDAGIDPRSSIDAALERFTRATLEDSSYVSPFGNMAFVLSIGANHELSVGRDPRPYAKRAVESCARAVQIDAAWFPALNNCGWAELAAAQYEEAIGVDPSATLDETESSFRTSLGLSKDEPDTHFGLGAAAYTRALYALRTGADPSAKFEEARKLLGRAVELDAQEPLIRLEQGRLAMTAARHAKILGKDTKPLLDEAEAALEEGVRINPRHAPLHAALAKLAALRAEFAPEKKAADQDKRIENGLAAADRALQINPHLALAMAAKGTLYAIRAQTEKGKTRAEDARRAVEFLEKAISTNPLLPQHVKDKLASVRALSGPRSLP